MKIQQDTMSQDIKALTEALLEGKATVDEWFDAITEESRKRTICNKVVKSKHSTKGLKQWAKKKLNQMGIGALFS